MGPNNVQAHIEMLPSLRGIVLLLLVLKEPTSSDSFRSDNAGSGLKTIEDIPIEFILSFETGNYLMDVFVPPECLKDTTMMIKAFLDSRAKPVTLWSDGRMLSSYCMYKICHNIRKLFTQIVYFICDKYNRDNVLHSLDTAYFVRVFVVGEQEINLAKNREMPFQPPYPRASGRYTITFRNGSLFLTSEFESKAIEHQTLKSGLLERRRTLNGSFVDLICESTYACEHPSFNVTLMLLTDRNASVNIKRYVPFSDLFFSRVINSFNYHGKHYSSGVHDSLHRFASAGFSFYVRKRVPVPKERIFILPFLWEVWVALLASCFLLALTYGLIAKVILKANPNLFLFVFHMGAAFFQQSTLLDTRLLNTCPYRLMYGVMALMFVVMSTAFKGCLTSLLNDLPLEGEAIQFVSFEQLVGTGYRLCFLENPGILGPVGPLMIFKTGGSIRGGHKCYETSNFNPQTRRSIKISADGRDTFFTYNSRTGPSEALRQELFRRGYVETRGTVFSYPVGPEMMSSSVYRQDFGTTVSRAIEAGIYERHAALANHKSRFFHEGSLEQTQNWDLNFGDLSPFFLAWFIGISFSVLVFIGEAILSQVGW